MCGRLVQSFSPEALSRYLDARLAAGVSLEEPARWNAAPTTELLGLARLPARTRPGESRPVSGIRVLGRYRWGFVPPWSTDVPSVGRRGPGVLTLARAETVATRPSFAPALRARRLAIPADGFFEWQRGPDGERLAEPRPHYVCRADGEPMVLAALWEGWRDPAADGPWEYRCAIVTTAAGPDTAGVHDRVPVVLERDAWDRWLDTEETEPAPLLPLLRASVPGTLVHHPVDRRVGNVRNDDPGLIAAVA